MNDYEIIFGGINLGQAPYCALKFEDVGSPELSTQEIDIPNEDGIVFGREYMRARKWTITGSVKGGDPYRPSNAAEVQQAWEAMSDLVAAWDNPDNRTDSRTVTYMTFQRPGRQAVRVYGRPERIDPDIEASWAGYIGYSAVFRQSDPLFYSEEEYVLGDLLLAVPYSGGLLYNAGQTAMQLPFTTTSYTARTGSFTATGNANSWAVVTINGPVLNPTFSVQMDNNSTVWEATIKTTLGSNESIVVDARPWSRSILRSDGASLAGALRGARLNEMIVPPGANEFVYSGTDGTGTSTANLKYRIAWSSL